jgi:chromosome partitioning protein
VLVDTTELYDEVIVDAGGFDSVELRTALAAADHLYSPVKASQSDLWTLEAMSELVLQARDLNPSLGAHLVLSLAPTNPSVSSARDARRLLEQYPAFGICEAVIHNRKAFEDATAGGRGVLEGPDVKAQNEILAFSREVMSHGISASLSQAS